MSDEYSVYEPREDSEMLKKWVEKLAAGKVLDMGTGSGIQALAAANKDEVSFVVALDVQEAVIDYCKKNSKHEKINYVQSDLFEYFSSQGKKTTFDCMIFNAPYLPQELPERDVALEGGKLGYETVERFLRKAEKYLEDDGFILLLFSALTKKDMVDEYISRYLFTSELLESSTIFFEELYVYKITKSDLLLNLKKEGVDSVRYFDKGKHGYIYTGMRNKRKVAIKIKNPHSEAKSTVAKEILFLKKVNEQNIGPRLVLESEDYLAYLFVEGTPIFEWITVTKDKDRILSMLFDLFNQLHVLDQMQISKDEMSHPDKHVLVRGDFKPVLIDFERSQFDENPSNVTQFSDYLMSKRVFDLLSAKKIVVDKEGIISAAKLYKKDQSKENFDRILGCVQ